MGYRRVSAMISTNSGMLQLKPGVWSYSLSHFPFPSATPLKTSGNTEIIALESQQTCSEHAPSIMGVENRLLNEV